LSAVRQQERVFLEAPTPPGLALFSCFARLSSPRITLELLHFYGKVAADKTTETAAKKQETSTL
jgi:hypothetical protein